MATQTRPKTDLGPPLPSSVDAERSVLGAVLLDNNALLAARELLEPEDFFLPQHIHIFYKMLELHTKSTAIDLVILTESLHREGELDLCGGSPYLASLVDGMPRVSNMEHYARIVKEKAQLRRLVHASAAIQQQAMESDGTSDEILNEARARLTSLDGMAPKQGLVPMAQIVRDGFAHIEKIFAEGKHVTGLSTGYGELDKLLAGLQNSELIIVAARPSQGKSAFALNLMENIAIRQNLPVAFFSLEMSRESLLVRLLSSVAQVDAHKFRSGHLSREDWIRLTNACGTLAAAPIWIDDSSTSTVGQIAARAERLKREKGLRLAVVDYLQLVGASRRLHNRQEEVSDVSRNLKALAKDLGLPVVALSQLNRKQEREDRAPMLSDLRECIAVDQRVYDPYTGMRVPAGTEHLRDIANLVSTCRGGGNIEIGSVERNWSVGEKQTFEVITQTGRTLVCTKEHRLLAFAGYTQLGELQVGQRIAVPRTLPAPIRPYNRINLKRARLLGYLLSCGSYCKHRSVSYAKPDLALVEDVRQIALDEFGVTAKNKKHWSGCPHLELTHDGSGPGSNPIIEWLKELKIHGEKSNEKCIPDELFSCSNEITGAFLASLWSGDGTVSRNRLKYSSTSLELVRGVQHLLLRFGILAIVSNPQWNTKSTMPIRDLLISDHEQIVSFANRIGLVGIKEKALKQLAEKNTKANAHIDRLPIEVTEHLHAKTRELGISWTQLGYRCQKKEMCRADAQRIVKRLRVRLLDDPRDEVHDLAVFLLFVSTSDLLWDKIVSIKKLDKRECCDLSVPNYRNYVVEDFISHNSGAIEQDADVVAFIHRPKFYDNEATPEERDAAEFIVAKQRNGPTDMVRFYFRSRYTRFEEAAPELFDGGQP